MRVRWRALLFVVVWALVVTLLRATRLPNDFAEAHWLVDYRFGFIKRGFVGSLTAILAAGRILPQTETTIAVLSLIAFGFFCIAMLLVMWRVVLLSNWSATAFLVVAVFATSPSIVMNAHLMGYFDHIFIVLGFVSAWLVIKDRPWAAAIVSAIAVLIHETYVVVGLPIVLLAAYVHMQVATEGRRVRRMAPVLLIPALTFLGLVAIEGSRTNRGYISLMLSYRLHTFPFIVEGRADFVPTWLTTSMQSYLEEQSPFLFERLASHSTWIIVPSIATLILFAAWAKRIRAVPLTTVAVIAVTLLPLALHVIAWDTGRISAYSILTSFGCVWVYSELNPPRPHDYSRFWPIWILGMISLIFNVFAHVDLMDAQLDRFSNATRAALYAPVVIGLLILAYVERRRLFRPM